MYEETWKIDMYYAHFFYFYTENIKSACKPS
jgi:hypothetical protein